jgi:hypothetical protein
VRNQFIQNFVHNPELLNLGIASIAAFDTRLRIQIDTPVHFGGNVTQLD